jgi:hypothetical protein
MEIQRTRSTPDLRLAVAAAIIALLAILLAEVWQRSGTIPSPVLDAPATLPVKTAPVPLSSAPPAEVTSAPAATAPATLAPADVPASVAPSAPPVTSSVPRADPSNPAAPNQLAPMDGDVPSVLPKVSLPPKGG